MVFKLDANGNETLLYGFTGKSDGGRPLAGLTRDSAGNLYGTVSSGGADGYGGIFKLDTAGKETVLYSFTGGSDGKNPNSPLLRDSSGNLYSTAPGGAANDGVVFKVDPDGNLTVLHSFAGTDGCYPLGNLAMDTGGNLYGATQEGGAYSDGTVYQLNTAGQLSVLYNFTGGSDGWEPRGGVILDSTGNLYGTTYGGGKNGTGVIFKITPRALAQTAGN